MNTDPIFGPVALKNKYDVSIGCLNNDRLVGRISYNIIRSGNPTWPQRPIMLIGDFYVVKEYRKQGIGTKLLEYCLNTADDCDFIRAVLYIDIKKEAEKHEYLVRFYSKFGFVKSSVKQAAQWELTFSPDVEILMHREGKKKTQ
jgi:GNAT superfamily N-acetyltransferase